MIAAVNSVPTEIVEQVAHDHQHDDGRDQDAERSGRGDGADRELLVVAALPASSAARSASA